MKAETSDRVPQRGEAVGSLVRRSVLGIRSAAGRSTGWVALNNGLVIASQSAVGYQSKVDLDLGGEQRIGGRVVWADVPHDLVAILPQDKLSLPPLILRPDLPRVGEVAFVASFLAGERFKLTPTIVTSVDRQLESLRLFEITVRDAVPGSPLLDSDGRVIGIAGLDLPRGSRARNKSIETLALPAAPLIRALGSFDTSRGGSLETRAPAYACPTCREPLSPELERCLTCGALLPHAFERELDPALDHMLSDAMGSLASLGPWARTGPRSFQLLAPSLGEGDPRATQPMSKRSVEVWIEVDRDVRLLSARVPLVRLVPEQIEPMMRFVLTLNEAMPPSFRLALRGDRVLLALDEPLAALRASELALLMKDLVRLSDHQRRVLHEAFDAKALYDLF